MFSIRLIAQKITAMTLMSLFLFSATSQAAVLTGDRSPWRVLAPTGGGFTVQMPGQPVREIYRDWTRYSYVEPTPVGNFYYAVTYHDLAAVPADVERMLREQCSEYASGFQGRVVRWVPVIRNGVRGLAAQVESTKKLSSIVAAWLVNRRIYLIAFASQKTQVIPYQARQFIDSFTLVRY